MVNSYDILKYKICTYAQKRTVSEIMKMLEFLLWASQYFAKEA